MILAFLVLIIVVVTVWWALPQLPRWARVGFWVMLTVHQIIQGDALFAAIDAAIATAEWNKS